jgi:hypothetical protein
MNTNEVIPGLITGVMSAVIFNPIDKIIFALSIQGRTLKTRDTFSNPFKGALNNIGTRLITSGLYFSYIDHYSSVTENKAQVALVTSLLCSITNPIQLVKYNSWFHNISSRQSISNIYGTHGVRGFGIGITAFIMRDFIFNYIYLTNKDKNNHLHNICVICGALSISSPFNLIRVKKYATNASIHEIVSKFQFRQLSLGFVIVRSCLSFYSGQVIYDYLKSNLTILQV